jgi:hypothetical protein
MYKITNYVLDEIHLTSSFNFLLQVLQHLTLIYKKRVGEGEEERTNPFLLHHCKIFRGAPPKRERNGKNRAKTGQDRAPSLFYPSWE